jgi:endonuclease III
MQANPSPEKVMAAADSLLVEQYGQRKWRRHGDAVELLVRTIISENTDQASCDAAYANLRHRYLTWEEVVDASEIQTMRIIHVCGRARQKTKCICGALGAIRAERKRIDLKFLGAMPVEEALDYLLQFDGVDHKTANCVLLLGLGMPAFPVDTHVLRIAKRLGLLKRKATAEQGHEILAPLIPPARRYAMHVLLIEHGRKVCRDANPRCEDCRLLEICPFGQRRMAKASRPVRHTAAWRRRHM